MYQSTTRLESIGQFFSVLAIFIIVVLIAYFTTRWIGGYQKGQMHNRNLQIIETLKVSNTQYIQIVKAGDVYLVIGISRDRIEKLAELDESQLAEISANQPVTMNKAGESFRDVLDKVKQRFPKSR